MIGAVVSRLRVLTLREVSAHPARSGALVVVLAVAAALLVAVITTYSSLTDSATTLSRAAAGDSDLAVLGYSDTGFDQSVTAAVAGVPGVAVAAPLLESVDSTTAPVALIGVDPSVARLRSPLQAALTSQVRLDPELLLDGDGVIVGAQMKLAAGQRFRYRDNLLTVASVVPAALAAPINDGHFVAAPLSVAQRVSGRQQQVDAIFVVADPGIDRAALRTAIARAVAGRALVTGNGASATQIQDALLLVRSVALLVAAVSLVVAAFLMFNATTMAVASRRAGIAMLRALGARRRFVVADLLVEATVTGLVAAAVGIPLGLGLARWAIGRTPAVLLQVVSARPQFHPSSLAYPAVIAACVVTSVAASLVAAYQVARIHPTEALRSADILPGEPLSRGLTVTAAMAAGAAFIVASLIAAAARSVMVVAAVAVLTVGLLAAAVAASRAVVAVAAWGSRLWGPTGRLAAASIHRAPRRAWATAMTVAVAVTIGVAVNSAVADLRNSASATFAPLRQSGLLIDVKGPGGFPSTILPQTWETVVRATPGVSRVAGGQWAYVTIGDLRVQIAGLAAGDTNVAGLLTPTVRAAMLAGRGVAVSRQLGDRLGLRVGSRLAIGTPTGIHDVRVLGEFGFLSVDAGVVAMDLGDLRAWFNRPGSSYLSVTADPGADIAALRGTVQAELPDARLFSGADAYTDSLSNINQAGAFTVGLQWIVALLAAFATMNTLTLAVAQRRREIGVLRAMGASRPLISRLVLIDAGAVGLVGGAVGIAGGEVVHVLADRVLGVLTGIEVVYAPNPVALWSAAIALAVCMAGALPPAFQATRLNVITAVAAR